LNLRPALSVTVLEVVKSKICLVVVNVTSADFVRRTSLDISVSFNSILGGVNVLLLELNKFIVVTSLVDLEERVELVHEGLALSEIEGFLSLDLSSEESDELEGNLVVLETFNVVTVLSASFLEERSNQIDVLSDTLLQPGSEVLCVKKFLLRLSEDIIEGSTFFTLSLNLISKSSNVLFEERFIDSPVGFELIKALLGIVQEIFKEDSSLVDTEIGIALGGDTKDENCKKNS
jgi:hypothetical protein